MSTSTFAPTPATSSKANPRDDDLRLTFPRVVRSEWIKFRTLRSTIWTLAITLVLMVGIVTLFSAVVASRATENDARSSSIFVFSIAADLAQLAVVVLGAAVPARLPVL